MGKAVKRCSRCRLDKPLTGFSRNRCKRDGYQNQCKLCHGRYSSGRDGAKYREHIEQPEWDAMMSRQGGRCAVCREAFPSPKATHVDHDHSTGVVRGLLCSGCNSGIGLLGESPDRLLAAAAYLRG